MQITQLVLVVHHFEIINYHRRHIIEGLSYGDQNDEERKHGHFSLTNPRYFNPKISLLKVRSSQLAILSAAYVMFNEDYLKVLKCH